MTKRKVRPAPYAPDNVTRAQVRKAIKALPTRVHTRKGKERDKAQDLREGLDSAIERVHKKYYKVMDALAKR